MSKKLLPDNLKEKLATLSKTELKYFQIMWAKSGVLFITAKPGVAKSAIARSIAEKMNFKYIDMRLSMCDETDFKFPFIDSIEANGKTNKVSDYAVPKWAFESNQQPTIIHFEELNRAPQFVRNAALQILLERQIGEFAFNDNVLMMSSGNLGDEDSTDVEEFDGALNNRLWHISHTLSFQDWCEGFANENVHRSIVSYLTAHPENLYKPATDASKAYATPRSWTFLSDYIVSNWGMDASAKDFINSIKEVACSAVGPAGLKYIQYCEDMLNINIQDVINNWDKVKKDIEKYNRDKKSELIQSLKEIEILKLNSRQLDNVGGFLKTVGDDERFAYLLDLVDNTDSTSDKTFKTWLIKNFKDDLVHMRELNDKS